MKEEGKSLGQKSLRNLRVPIKKRMAVVYVHMLGELQAIDNVTYIERGDIRYEGGEKGRPGGKGLLGPRARGMSVFLLGHWGGGVIRGTILLRRGRTKMGWLGWFAGNNLCATGTCRC